MSSAPVSRTFMSGATRAEVCAVACAKAWRGDGEIAASPFGVIPTIGARLARATFAPDLLLSDGEATFVAGCWAVGEPPDGPAEGWVPYRAVFDLLAAGKRHVTMGPSQIDRFGNVNISAIGDFTRPARQLIAGDGGRDALFAVRAADTVVAPAGTLDQSRSQAAVSLRGAPGLAVGCAAERAEDLLRVMLAVESVGAAAHCLDVTVGYLKTRVQFGRPIGAFQALRHRCADLAVEVASARATAYAAFARLRPRPGRRRNWRCSARSPSGTASTCSGMPPRR